eukprot:ANDGO_08288.mRNA.1 hypothetical protein
MTLTHVELEDLYKWRVPLVLTADGLTCSHELDPNLFDLGTRVFNIPDDDAVRRNHPVTANLIALSKWVRKLQEAAGGPEWVGIYKLMDCCPQFPNEKCLIKMSYIGAPSRVFFPYSLKDVSNNVRVAMTKAVISIEDVAAHDGAYYECDGRVRSELCAPIVVDDAVVGIVDLESFTPGHFSSDRKAAILKICQEIAESNLLSV